MQNPVAASNFETLNTKSLEIQFDLDGTDYVALENIGTGAYGVVCSAINRRRNGERVAIKKIPDIFGQVTIATRTYREIKILKHFRHDNIISIRDILQPRDDDLKTYRDVYIVLDLMESDLHRIIYSPQQLTDEHVRYFLYQILRGLKYIHSANIVHRDLKPSNLLVNENCELKIGDFGMARGMSSSPEDRDIKMTQYVATRWYRAPELILLTLNYTAAIDMWSVGCILAEMLGRRHLFPGKNYRHQLELIFSVVGSPSDNYINMTSDIIGDFLRKFPRREPGDLRTLYPSASAKAVRLIGQMLKMEPDSRISAEDALNDPYLSRYHDPEDEPICVPVFDFSFEKQDMNAERLRDAITAEMLHYRHSELQMTRGSYVLRPVCSGESSVTAEQSHVKFKPSTTSTVINTFNQSESLAATGTDDAVNDDGLVDGRVKPGVPGISTTEVKVDGNSVEMPSASACQQSETDDVTMLSARSITDADVKLKDGICQQETCGKSNNWTDTSAVRDNCTDTTAAGNGTQSNSSSLVVESNPSLAADAKARIKAALLDSDRQRQRRELVELAAINRCRAVTALQRQREREELRRQKRERARQRRKKKNIADSGEAEGPLLTDEDRTLLERWKSIYPRSSLSISSDESQSTLPATDSVDRHISETQSPGSSSVLSNDKEVLLPADVAPSLWTDGLSAVQTDCTATCQLSVLPSLVPSAVATIYLSPAKIQPSFSSLLAQTNNNLQQAVSRSPELLTSLNVSECGHGQERGDFNEMTGNGLLSPYHELLVARMPSLVTTTKPLFQNTTSQATVGVRFLHDNQLPEAVPIPVAWKIYGGVHTADDGNEGEGVGDGVSSRTNMIGSLVDGTKSNGLRVITSRMMRSHVDNLTLRHTPRGTGAGYGVGVDFAVDLLSSGSRAGQEGPESAPLSSSLMDDWRYVTGDIDARDLEATLQEMGAPHISLTDLTSARLLIP